MLERAEEVGVRVEWGVAVRALEGMNGRFVVGADGGTVPGEGSIWNAGRGDDPAYGVAAALWGEALVGVRGGVLGGMGCRRT